MKEKPIMINSGTINIWYDKFVGYKQNWLNDWKINMYSDENISRKKIVENLPEVKKYSEAYLNSLAGRKAVVVSVYANCGHKQSKYSNWIGKVVTIKGDRLKHCGCCVSVDINYNAAGDSSELGFHTPFINLRLIPDARNNLPTVHEDIDTSWFK